MILDEAGMTFANKAGFSGVILGMSGGTGGDTVRDKILKWLLGELGM